MFLRGPAWSCPCERCVSHLCFRTSEGRRHAAPALVSWEFLVRTGLHLQAAVPCGPAVLWSLRIQGEHLLPGRTRLHDSQAELQQSSTWVRLRLGFYSIYFFFFFPLLLDSHMVSSCHRSAMLDCESDNSGNSHQSLLEAASVQAQIIEGEFSAFATWAVIEGNK